MFNEKIRKSDENITSDIMPNQIWGIDEGLYKYPYLLISFSFFFKFLFLFSGLGFFSGGGGLRWGGVSYYKIMKKILAEFEYNKVM